MQLELQIRWTGHELTVLEAGLEHWRLLFAGLGDHEFIQLTRLAPKVEARSWTQEEVAALVARVLGPHRTQPHDLFSLLQLATLLHAVLLAQQTPVPISAPGHQVERHVRAAQSRLIATRAAQAEATAQAMVLLWTAQDTFERAEASLSSATRLLERDQAERER